MSNKPKRWTIEIRAADGAPFNRRPRVYSEQGSRVAERVLLCEGYGVRRVHLMPRGTGLVDCTGCDECKS